MNTADPLQSLLTEFAERIRATVQQETVARISSALAAPPSHGKGSRLILTGQQRPRQLCPVPGCVNAPAPRYGMVCKVHKDLPKAEIRKYREERKASMGKKSRGATVPIKS